MRLVITGDKSRYQFFRSIVKQNLIVSDSIFCTEKIGMNDIYLTSERNLCNKTTFYSAKVPLNTTLFFPKEYSNETVKFEKDDRVLFFDEFPFSTDEEISKIEQFRRENEVGQFEIVLFLNDREALSSDISTEEMALEDAECRYKQYGYSVLRYSIDSNPDFLFWSINGQDGIAEKSFHKILDEAKNYLCTFESCYDLEYELFLRMQIESPEILDSHFVYNKNLKNKNVWETYVERAIECYWIKINTESFIEDIYFRAISDLCIWDLSEDINVLNQRLQAKFIERIVHHSASIFYGEKDEYAEFLNENMKEIIDFKHKIVVFFSTEIKEILKKHIEENIYKMEELLNECNY